MNVLPAWLAAFVVVSVASGMSSAANGCAAAAGTFFVRHIFPLVTGRFPENPVVAVRWALTCAFTLSTTIALYTGSIVDFVLKFLPLTMSGLAIILVVGRLWRRATWQGAMAALIVTAGFSMAAQIFWSKSPLWSSAFILAIPGFAAHIIVSLLSPPPTRTFEEVADELTRQRRQIENVPAHLHHVQTPAPVPEAAVN
jgi:SSS family solute:Na+ symporter